MQSHFGKFLSVIILGFGWDISASPCLSVRPFIFLVSASPSKWMNRSWWNFTQL